MNKKAFAVLILISIALFGAFAARFDIRIQAIPYSLENEISKTLNSGFTYNGYGINVGISSEFKNGISVGPEFSHRFIPSDGSESLNEYQLFIKGRIPVVELFNDKVDVLLSIGGGAEMKEHSDSHYDISPVAEAGFLFANKVTERFSIDTGIEAAYSFRSDYPSLGLVTYIGVTLKR